MQFYTRRSRDAFVSSLAKVANGQPEIVAFDDAGRPCRIEYRPDGERSVEIEIVRE